MPGPQWSTPDKKPPRHAPPPVRVFATGPDEYGDRDRVWAELDKLTIRLENLEVVTLGEGKTNRDRRDGEWVWLGVTRYAFEWAEREWWNRVLVDPAQFGRWPGKFDNTERTVLELVGKDGYCLALWDGRCKRTARLMESVRDQIPASHFRYRRV